jgi:hypothetical protein
VFPRFQYGTGANQLQPFVLAHHLRATLRATTDMALDDGLRLTVVGWHGSLGGVYVCKDGCAEGQHGTDLDYIEARLDRLSPSRGQMAGRSWCYAGMPRQKDCGN